MKVQRKPGPGKLELRHILNGLGDKVARVGFFPKDKYDDKARTPVAYVAAIQEFGSPQQGIPPRSFMRSTAEERKGEWASLARSGAKAVVKGSATATQVMDGIGQQAAGDIKRTISKITSPELKQSTIDARLRKMADGKTVGSLNKPLIDSTLLYESVWSEVGDK